jgi:hypothetical protein
MASRSGILLDPGRRPRPAARSCIDPVEEGTYPPIEFDTRAAVYLSRYLLRLNGKGVFSAA